MEVKEPYKRKELSPEENLALQLYIQDPYSIIKITDDLVNKNTKGETGEAKCKAIFLKYIDDSYHHFLTEGEKNPDAILPGYNISYNAQKFLENFMEVDKYINDGFARSIRHRYSLGFSQLANLTFEKAGYLFKGDSEILASGMEEYTTKYSSMHEAIQENFNKVVREIKNKSNIIHPYCIISYNDYLKLA